MKNLCLSLLRWGAIAPLSTGIALASSLAARADDLALSFDLSPNRPQPTVAQAPLEPAPTQIKPLEIPAQAAAIPLGASDTPMAIAPPPPRPVSTNLSPQLSPQVKATAAEPPATPTLSFDIPTTDVAPVSANASTELTASPQNSAAHAAAPSIPTVKAEPEAELEAELFEGGSESLVARAVGSAEGTRTPEGHRTPAYYGHVDPGNGVWNLGSFSYQHGASSPEEADVKQLARLRQQAQVLQQKAIARNITLTLEERLNGIDLANQAPMAALGKGGYVDWLDQAHQMGMRGSDAVLWARTRSFLDPDTRQWDAPGLGNSLHRISSDQERRQVAIARAIEADQHQPKFPQSPESTQLNASQPPQKQVEQEAAIDRLFAQEVPSPFASASSPSTPAPSMPDEVLQAPATDSDLADSELAVDAILNLDLPESVNSHLGS
jgi:hypothetical protein